MRDSLKAVVEEYEGTDFLLMLTHALRF